MSYEILDLFSGAGGLSFGFQNAGFRIKNAIEVDKDAVKTHEYNFPDTDVFQFDITQMDPKEHFKEGDFDVIIGGPPCQGFSNIGRPKIASLVRNGTWGHMKISNPRFIDDPRNNLYRKFVEFVDVLQPSFFVVENVRGLLSYKKGNFAKQILEDFQKINYETQMQLVVAADYGVPQMRQRLFIVGTNRNLPFNFPTPRYFAGNSSNSNNDGNSTPLTTYISLGSAILDLPEIDNGCGDEEMGYTKKPETKYQQIMRQYSKKVRNHVSRRTNERDLKAFKALKEGQIYRDLPQNIKDSLPYRQDIFKDKFRKLNSKKPSWTIVAHLYKDGNMFIHPKQARSITVREAARIQSFPDSFIFQGSRTAQFKQVGNAVPPLMAQAMAEEILKGLTN